MSTLEEVRNQLQSSKFREQQKALTTIRRIFQRDSVVARHTRSKGQSNRLLIDRYSSQPQPECSDIPVTNSSLLHRPALVRSS